MGVAAQQMRIQQSRRMCADKQPISEERYEGALLRLSMPASNREITIRVCQSSQSSQSALTASGTMEEMSTRLNPVRPA